MIYNQEILLESLNLPEEEKKKIIEEIKKDFPDDEMLFELHLFRVIWFLNKQKNK